MHTPPTPQSSLSSLFSPRMATPAFLLWSSSQENRNDGTSTENRLQPLPDPSPKDSSPARPKPRKASKAAGAKRPPQRGLGVAQLERLRLQERWKKITEVDPAHEIQPFPGQLPVYDCPAAVAPLAGYAYGGGCSQAPGMCYAQRCLPVSPGLAGYRGGAVAVRPILCEQYSLDRCRMGMGGWEGRFQVGRPLPKLKKVTAPKRPRQRGLGIAQLERLRLQERWKMITEIDPALDIQPFPGHLPVYDYPSTVAPLAAFVAPAPAPASIPPSGAQTTPHHCSPLGSPWEQVGPGEPRGRSSTTLLLVHSLLRGGRRVMQ